MVLIHLTYKDRLGLTHHPRYVIEGFTPENVADAVRTFHEDHRDVTQYEVRIANV